MTTHAKRRVGRPALSPDTQRITVTLRPADIEYLDKLSDTRSGAIRKLIERDRNMNYIIIKHEGEEVGQVHTNRSLTKDEALELAGIDVNEMDGGDPKWDYDAFELEPLSDAEYHERYA